MKSLLLTFIALITFGYSYSQVINVVIKGGNPDNCTGNAVAGTYSLSGTANGRNQYVKGVHTMSWSGTRWEINESGVGITLYDNSTNSTIPPCGDWLGSFGCFTIDVSGGCQSACSNPTVPTVTYTPASVCEGGNATLNISGNLNDAIEWEVYTGSCGGTLIGRTSTSTFTVPAPNGSTLYYVRGVGGCVTPGSCGSVTVTTTANDNASFGYAKSSYCESDADPTPTITGVGGGTFTSSPGGLMLNPSTGQIDVSVSSHNTYTVTYTTNGTCPNSSDQTVTINGLDNANFSYSASAYCTNAGDPSPTITGLGGGTFTSAPGGLSINGGNGAIDVSASTPSSYTVTYTTSGTCPNSSNQTVTINTLDNASFSYPASAYCANDTDPTPTITGLGGGNFSSAPAGLSINTGTGAIDVSASTSGVYTVTYTTTGTCPNSSNVSVVIDTTSPTAVCQNITVFLTGAGNAIITAADLDNGSTDNCGGVTLGASQTVFTCANVGSNNVTLTATDGSGNSSTCISTVTVVDTTSPTAVCQNITVFLDGSGNASITAGDVNGGSSDNCSLAGISVTPSSFTCSNIGGNTVTLTVTDGSSNTATCSATVTVIDTTSPTAVCQDITVYLDGSGNTTITSSDIDGGSTDNCGSVTLSASKTAFTCSDAGVNNVTLTVTDGNSNTSTCTAVVTVVDTTSPIASCQDITVFIDGTGNATITAADLDNGSTDNCGGVTLSASQTVFTCANIGANNVTLTVTDGNSNTSTCTSTVTVVDTTSPTATCQDITVFLDGSGNANIVAADLDNGSSDNCGSLTASASTTAFTCANIGANNVTLTVTDGSSNISTCTSTVTVADTTSPTAVCQNITVYLDASGNASVSASDLDNGSSDNCGSVTFSASQTAFTCAHIGSNNVTLTVTDASGNTSMCSSIVAVIDSISPDIVCPVNPVESISTACDFTIPDYTSMASVSDVCDPNPVVTQSVVVGTVITANDFPYSIWLYATDVSGNVDSCSFELLLNDTVDRADTLVVSACSQYVFAGNVITASGFYTDSLQSINGCDSITVVDLTIYLPTNDTLTQASVCAGDSTLVLGNFESTQGWYTQMLTSVNGCDSIVNQELVVLPNTTTIVNDTICKGDSLIIGGVAYKTSQTIFDTTGTSSNGCNAIDEHRLFVEEVLPAVFLGEDISVCSEYSITLSALTGYDSYLWSTGDTTESIVIDGTAYGVGSYDIILTVSKGTRGCTDTDTLNVQFNNCVGITEQGAVDFFNVYPNPTSGYITVDVDLIKEQENVQLEIRSLNGQLVMNNQIRGNGKQQLDLANYSNGMYYISLVTERYKLTKKIILKR